MSLASSRQGRSLELYFIDGRPDGMLTAEVFNWTGHVLMAPRTQIAEALQREEAGYTGVYLLLGERDGVPLAALSVTDQGLGVPAADLPLIFERFQRARNVEGRIGGTGIGLASARQIVQHHGGSISATSREGAGSTFTVLLPLAPPGLAGESSRTGP